MKNILQLKSQPLSAEAASPPGWPDEFVAQLRGSKPAERRDRAGSRAGSGAAPDRRSASRHSSPNPASARRSSRRWSAYSDATDRGTQTRRRHRDGPADVQLRCAVHAEGLLRPYRSRRRHFPATPTRAPVGLLTGKKAYVFAARGGYYAGTPHDTQTAYVRQFLGFLGIDGRRVRIRRRASRISEASKQASLSRAAQAIERFERAVTRGDRSLNSIRKGDSHEYPHIASKSSNPCPPPTAQA